MSTETGTPIPEIDPAKHLSLDDLERRFQAIPARSPDAGHLAMIVARGPDERRLPQRSELTAREGVSGDRWRLREDGQPDDQITIMDSRVADLIGNGQPWTLFGDNLFADLDVSVDNLPLGTRLRIGLAEVEVTAEPHNGCLKFRDRFGRDALRFVAQKETRRRNLRGIYVRVIIDGAIAIDDAVVVLHRG